MHFLRLVLKFLAFSSIVVLDYSLVAAATLPHPNDNSSNNIDLPPYSLRSHNASTLKSHHSSDSIDALSVILPYGFAVPNTQTYLRLGFGLPRKRLDPMGMGGLIAVVQYEIEMSIEREGADFHPWINYLEQQMFTYTLGDGFSLILHSTELPGRYFTLQQAANVVEGLRLFSIVGEKFYATEFNFWDGPGRFRLVLGGGGIVVDGNGVEELAEQKGLVSWG